jgi:sugar phosphate isomerase/epimerase
MITRREWMRSAGQAVLGAAVANRFGEYARADSPARPTVCFFSKHLPDLQWSELGKAVKGAGFDGVDLTVRAKGHVLPERPDDLPRAVDAITSQGSAVPMITTDLTSASDPRAKPLLQTAVRCGVQYFKPGYWLYSSPADVRAQVAAASEAVIGLGTLAQDCGIQMGFHNHAGYIGAALWEIAPAIDRLDPKWAGYYFDPRHAVAEGGGGIWKAAAHLVAPRLKMVALKDFFWEKSAKGWQITDCPLGEGAVDWTWVGAWLRDIRFAGPISIHFEYDIPGNTAQERTRRTLDAAQRDLAFARRFLA